MERVFVTGASGYIGGKLISRLAERNDVKSIVGIDVNLPPVAPEKLTFYRRDVRERFGQFMRDHHIDTVVHLAYVVAPIHSVTEMEDVNVNGTRSILRAAEKASVKQVLYTSSATAYGFHPDNDVPLTEKSPLRGNRDFTYSKTKRELEDIFSRFAAHNPKIAATVIRPSFVVGPGFNDPLARHVRKRIVPMPSKTHPFQFVHEDDLVDIMLLLLERRAKGAFNVGADGTISSGEMVRLLGNTRVALPFWLMYALTEAAWNLRLKFVAEFPGAALDMARYQWVVSSEKVKRELGFQYRYTTAEAYRDFVRHVKGRQ
jgi:UDP-glucose 4-epimerase